MHILHTVLYTFPKELTRRIYLKNLEHIQLAIISFILVTLMFHSVVILKGEILCTLSGQKINGEFFLHVTHLIVNSTPKDQNFRITQHRGHLFIRDVLGEHNSTDHFTVAFISTRNLFELHILTYVHIIVSTNIRSHLCNEKTKKNV